MSLYDIPSAFVLEPSCHGISVRCQKFIINIVWVRVALAFFRALSYFNLQPVAGIVVTFLVGVRANSTFVFFP